MKIAFIGLGAVISAKDRLTAIVSLGIQGFAVALIFMLFGAPDLSFTQFMVETLSVVILALVMTRLRLSPADHRPTGQKIVDATVSIACGAGFMLYLLSVTEVPFRSYLSDFFIAYSKTIAHGANIVNVIIVDFRGTDTLGEIAVVMVTGLAILSLIRVRPGWKPGMLAENDPDAPRHVIARGLPASPGAAVGKAVFSSDRAEDLAAKGEAVILVRPETSPEDIHGMHAARAILTSRGGMTSHAAVVARGMGRPCITGTMEIRIDAAAKTFATNTETIREGDLITVDGTLGEVLKGEIPTIEPELSGAFETLMGWADEIRTLGVRANAETPRDAATARKFGAEGIGLCRTEHMFFDAERIISMREMILAEDSVGRQVALAKLLPMQRQDFVELFTIMAGLPVTIRLLDPPLHEFLPHGESEMREVAEATALPFQEVRARVEQLRENNPMLGHRGCRLGISHPEIYEMQARAIFEAILDVAEVGVAKTAVLEIMIPLVLGSPEIKILRKLIEDVADEIESARGTLPPYIVGTMIELPRAALRADDIAEAADFFSFGTNDLTQTSLGISRDDAASFMDSYVRQGLFERDPFASLDIGGVGELVETACKRGRRQNSDLKLGICGEHGGDPASIRFFHQCGLNYVSCSPYRVPIARLAAAQAQIGRD